MGISIVVICAAVLVRYGNSLSSTYGGSAGLVLGHDIAPSKLLEGLTLPALHRDFFPVCVFKLHCPVCMILGPGRRHHLQLSRHDRGKLHAAASQQTANHFFFKAVKDEDKEVRKSSLFWWVFTNGFQGSPLDLILAAGIACLLAVSNQLVLSDIGQYWISDSVIPTHRLNPTMTRNSNITCGGILALSDYNLPTRTYYSNWPIPNTGFSS